MCKVSFINVYYYVIDCCGLSGITRSTSCCFTKIIHRGSVSVCECTCTCAHTHTTHISIYYTATRVCVDRNTLLTLFTLMSSFFQRSTLPKLPNGLRNPFHAASTRTAGRAPFPPGPRPATLRSAARSRCSWARATPTRTSRKLWWLRRTTSRWPRTSCASLCPSPPRRTSSHSSPSWSRASPISPSLLQGRPPVSVRPYPGSCMLLASRSSVLEVSLMALHIHWRF